MAIEVDTSLTPPENCPRFDYCEINACPLHPDYKKLKNDASDPCKNKCTNKRRRMAIAKAFGLKNLGLRPRELSAKKMWDAMPESEKKAKIDKIRGLSPVSKLLDAGCVIIPKKQSQSQNPHTKEETIKKIPAEYPAIVSLCCFILFVAQNTN